MKTFFDTLTPEHPLLTAYALGELDGDERAAVEAAVQADPALGAAVKELRAFAGTLTRELAEEGGPAEAEAGVLAFEMPEPEPVAKDRYARRRKRSWGFYPLVAGLAAACMVAMVWREKQAMSQKSAIVADLYSSRRAAAEEMAEMKDKAKFSAASKEEKDRAEAVAAAADATERRVIELQLPANLAKDVKSDDDGVVNLAPFVAEKSKDAGYLAQNLVIGVQSENESARTRTSPFGMIGGKVGAAGSVGWNAPVAYAATRLPGAAVITGGFNTEAYSAIHDNGFLAAKDNPLSTFSIDVDTASYANVRRFLTQGRLPPPDAVRIEELVNYFPYSYAAPKSEAPFSANLEVASAPWAPEHRLVRIGLKGREVATAERPAANLIFLLDVSGSMEAPNKLPLVKAALRELVGTLKPEDHVAIVTYAGASGLALPSTPAAKSREILEAVDSLRPEGSTNGAMGIQLAYDIAKANFVRGGVNRVILCTDGDFNVGVTSDGELTRLIEEKAKSGVFLTVLGFGMGNYKDSTLEQLADKGNGAYGYVDSEREAHKLLVEQAGGTLVTIAKDVKIQVEFNPAQVAAYRLIGYENRMLKKEDFNDDKVDAGEIGAGHTVTALYEIVPAGQNWSDEAGVDALKYAAVPAAVDVAATGGKIAVNPELLTVKIRYKAPEGENSERLDFPLVDSDRMFAQASADFKFAAAVAGWGMALRDSSFKGTATADAVLGWAEDGLRDDPGGYRGEFLQLVRRAKALGER